MAPPQPSEAALDWLPSQAGGAAAPPFLPVFLARRRRRLVARDEEGEDAEEEVDVMELGFVFLAFSPADPAKEDGGGGAARPLRFPNDSGSEHGFRNGERLSLSLQKTTAMEPPTTGPPAAPPAPPGPRRSMLSFPEPTLVPVVLLTPSRTRTDTLDCSFPFLSFLDFPDRIRSFLLLLFRTFSFPTFLTLFADESPGAPAAGPGAPLSEDRLLLAVLVEDDSAFLGVCVFFLG